MFFFNDTATTEIYTLSLHDALPILRRRRAVRLLPGLLGPALDARLAGLGRGRGPRAQDLPRQHRHGLRRSEEHTSELQSRQYLVCRVLLEKKKSIIRRRLLWTELNC